MDVHMAGSGVGERRPGFPEDRPEDKDKEGNASGMCWKARRAVSGGESVSVLVQVAGPQIYTSFQFPARAGGSANSLFRGR